eukprot:scaffold60459_cov72-Phaeocystis_antarctica.AAC.2
MKRHRAATPAILRRRQRPARREPRAARRSAPSGRARRRRQARRAPLTAARSRACCRRRSAPAARRRHVARAARVGGARRLLGLLVLRDHQPVQRAALQPAPRAALVECKRRSRGLRLPRGIERLECHAKSALEDEGDRVPDEVACRTRVATTHAVYLSRRGGALLVELGPAQRAAHLDRKVGLVVAVVHAHRGGLRRDRLDPLQR